MDEFHFLRPWWLVALPFGVLVILRLARMQARGGGWRNVVDEALQPFVLAAPRVAAERRWPLAAALAAWVLATVALAGPAWERLPVPAFRSNEALVVALDLSRSMDAADLSPSRLARAKLKLLSLLERRDGGQVGLVVFSAHAFTVTPLTTDTRTIAALVAALSSDIMPSQGSYVETGLDKAAALLGQTGVTDGQVLVITDAGVSEAALEKARELKSDGLRVHVLAVGTEDGAPIPEPDGGFYTDDSGNVVVPRLDAGGLARLADAGGGRFARLTADDRDLDLLVGATDALALAEGPAAGGAEEGEYEADVWRDAGLWAALLLLPFMAALFRRGWVALWLCCLLLPPPEASAQAPAEIPAQQAPPRDGPAAGGGATSGSAEPGGGETAGSTERGGGETAGSTEPGGGETGGFSLRDGWDSLWQRPDQRGADAMAENRPARAAQLFDDPEWRGAAAYRAGDFATAAAALSGVDTADSHYNRGNALARAGELEPAITAYDRALELNPGHEDARYNRDLVAKLLEENQENRESQQQSASDSGQEQGEQQASGESSSGASEGGSAGDESGERQASSEPNAGETEDGAGERGAEDDGSAADAGQREGEAPPGESDQPGENEERQAAEAEPSAAPQDLEQWASEQAADQWLRRIPQDPGGLLRRKFLYQYQRLGVDQDGNYVWPGDRTEPW